ncbi:MAG: hypothetical protein ABW328_21440 [Ilumatobacteraceae bacterium]
MTDLMDRQPLPPPIAGARPGPERPPRRTPVAVRVLWKVFAGIFVVAALFWGTYNVVVLLAHEERAESSSYPAGDLTALDVSSSAGSVRIVATDGDTVDVRAEISDGLRSTGERQEVVGGVLQLRASCPNIGSDWCRVDYEISVPRDLALTVSSGNGRVEVTGTTGPVAVDADDGTVVLTSVTGPLDVSTDNGRVEGVDLGSATTTADSDNGRVTLEFSAAPTTVVATTDNGSVEVVVPADGTTYRLSLETGNGSRIAEVPDDPASDRSITLRTDNGSVTARTAAS